MENAYEVESKSPTDTKAPKTEEGKTVPPAMWFDLCPFQILL